MKHPFNLKHPIHILATGFGSGLIKPAPGTWGTLAAAIIYFFALSKLSLPVFYGVTLVSILIGGYICGKTASDCGTHDHGSIVWDEFAGLWLTLAIVSYYLATTGTDSVHLYWQIAAFIWFRVFDIAKPFPIGWLDKKVSGGTGIMLDDLIAGLYAAGIVILTIKAYALFLGI